jgi:hypothetical protein
MEFEKLAPDFYERLQMSAGVICKGFVPSTGKITGLMGATTGGFQFASNPNYVDIGEDVDNAKPNTWQLKRVTSYDPAASGTFVEINAERVKDLIGAAKYGTTGGATPVDDETHIIPTHELTEDDFESFWVIGDYSAYNDGESTAGYFAIHIMHALNTAGFQWQSSKEAKGQFSFDYHGHYDLTTPGEVPFEVYVKAGTAAE